jgi:hypothetical protein
VTARRRKHYQHYRMHGASNCLRCDRFREWAYKSGHKDLLNGTRYKP